MLNNTPSLDLVEFIETQILPKYNAFDRAHNLEHVTRVIRRSLDLVKSTGADINMVYTIAAYHDLGMSGHRADHHLRGGKILAADARLKKWFSVEQIKVMKEAVEDHRASASRAPRSIYGKIVAEADRDIDTEVVIRRTVQFGFANYPELDKEGHWKRFKEHMNSKYSKDGYIKLWIPNSPNAQKLNELRNLIAQPIKLWEAFSESCLISVSFIFFCKNLIENRTHLVGLYYELAQFVKLAFILRSLYPQADITIDGVFLVHVLHKTLPMSFCVQFRIVGQSILDGSTDNSFWLYVAVSLSYNLAIDAAWSP